MTIYIALFSLILIQQYAYALTDPPPIPSARENVVDENKEQHEQEQEDVTNEKCKWGVDAGCGKSGSNNTPGQQQQEEKPEPKFGIPQKITIPSNQHYEPPEGFQLTTRVYTSTEDQLSYFDDDPPPLPYLEYCAATTTTGALPLQHAYFRSLLTSTYTWEGAEFGPHTASLLITLQDDTTIELNSGESQTFDAGAVILMEDVIGGGGHKIRGPSNSKQHKDNTNEENNHHHGDMEVTVLLLTMLPTSRVVVGKDKSPILSACDRAPRPRGVMLGLADDVSKTTRTLVLTLTGAFVSSIVANFIVHVVPMGVSVGVAGGCLIAGGSYGFCKGGERLWQYLEERNYRIKKREEEDEEEDEVEPPIEL